MTDEMREITVNGVRYFNADDVERWHRDYVTSVERADALAEALREIAEGDVHGDARYSNWLDALEKVEVHARTALNGGES